MEQQQEKRLKTSVDAAVRHLFLRMQHIAPDDRFCLLMEYMEWIFNDWEDLDLEWMDELNC